MTEQSGGGRAEPNGQMRLETAGAASGSAISEGSSMVKERSRMLPGAGASESRTSRWIGVGAGRKPQVKAWTEAEAEREAERLIRVGLHPRTDLLIWLLRDFIALTEERLYVLDGTSSTYVTFTKRLGEFRQGGICDLAAENVVSVDLRRSGLKPMMADNRRAYRVWTLGPVGRAISRKLWDVTLAPVGSEIHLAHHALAGEVLYRYVDYLARNDGRRFEALGPQQAVIWDFERRVMELSPDGMLVEIRDDGTKGDCRVLEFHNELSPGRALSKIKGYDQIISDPATREKWQYAWGIESRPYVIVVYRHDGIRKDYERQLIATAKERTDLYGAANLIQFKLISVQDVLKGNPVKGLYSPSQPSAPAQAASRPA